MKLAIMGLEAERTEYGLPLRAYAMQTVLAEEGHKVELVLYRVPNPRTRKDLITILGALWKRIIHRKSIRLASLRTRKFARFYEDLAAPVVKEGAQALAKMPAFDGYISGPGAGAFADSTMQVYTMPFAKKNVPKVGYAISTDGAKPAEAALTAFAEQAKGLTALSAREGALAEMLGAETHVDPVLLLGAAEWLQHTASVMVPDIPYGVCHFSEKDPLARKIVSDLAHSYGVPMFNISERGIRFGGTDRRFQNCDPRTFVKLIGGSAFCVGDTDLLAYFAGLFQKPMLVLARERNRETVLPFLRKIGRENCYVGQGEINQQAVILMQQDTAAHGLAAWQNDSHDWLLHAVEHATETVE